MIAGDLNELSTTYLQSRLRLHQSVNVSTHNTNILDVLIANRPDLLRVHVWQSLIKTKHKALIVNANSLKAESVQRGSRRRRVQVWDYKPLSASFLRQALSRYNWRCVIAALNSDAIDSIYIYCVRVRKRHIKLKLFNYLLVLFRNFIPHFASNVAIYCFILQNKLN